jgi:hypothetical protein
MATLCRVRSPGPADCVAVSDAPHSRQLSLSCSAVHSSPCFSNGSQQLVVLTVCVCVSAGNILFSLEHPAGVISLASAMVLVHVLGSYQVYTVPGTDP